MGGFLSSWLLARSLQFALLRDSNRTTGKKVFLSSVLPHAREQFIPARGVGVGGSFEEGGRPCFSLGTRILKCSALLSLVGNAELKRLCVPSLGQIESLLGLNNRDYTRTPRPNRAFRGQ